MWLQHSPKTQHREVSSTFWLHGIHPTPDSRLCSLPSSSCYQIQAKTILHAGPQVPGCSDSLGQCIEEPKLRNPSTDLCRPCGPEFAQVTGATTIQCLSRPRPSYWKDFRGTTFCTKNWGWLLVKSCATPLCTVTALCMPCSLLLISLSIRKPFVLACFFIFSFTCLLQDWNSSIDLPQNNVNRINKPQQLCQKCLFCTLQDCRRWVLQF